MRVEGKPELMKAMNGLRYTSERNAPKHMGQINLTSKYACVWKLRESFSS